jgi:hypothetical protein
VSVENVFRDWHQPLGERPTSRRARL